MRLYGVERERGSEWELGLFLCFYKVLKISENRCICCPMNKFIQRGVVFFTGVWNSSVSFFFSGLEFVTVGKGCFGMGLVRVNRSCVGLIISRDQ